MLRRYLPIILICFIVQISWAQEDLILDRIFNVGGDITLGLDISGNRIVLAHRYDGVIMLNIQPNQDIEIVDMHENLTVGLVYLFDNLLVTLSDESNCFYSINGNELNLEYMFENDERSLKEPAVQNNMMYIPDYWGRCVWVYDISDINNPFEIQSFDTEMAPRKVSIYENYILVAGDSRNEDVSPLACYNLENDFERLWTWNLSENVNQNDVRDHILTDTLLFALGANELHSLSLRGDEAPVEIAFIDEDTVLTRNRISLRDNFLLAYSEDPASIELYDMLNPYSPRLIAESRGIACYGIEFFSNNYLYASAFGNQSIYGFDISLATQDSRIPINNNRFELISFCREPSFETIDSLFANWEGLQIVATDDGQYFIPGLVNTLDGIDVSKGYRVFTTSLDTVRLRKPEISEDQLYHIEANRWNWIGYPYTSPTTIEQGLDWVYEEIAIIMNDDGQICIPYVVDNLDQFTPGEGYFVFSSFDLEFEFQPPIGEILNQQQPPSQTLTKKIQDESEITPTGMPYVVLVNVDFELEKPYPANIEVYDGETLVGASEWDSDADVHPVVCWQGFPEFGLVGFTPGNKIIVKVLDADGRIVGSSITNDELRITNENLSSIANDDQLDSNRSYPILSSNPQQKVSSVFSVSSVVQSGSQFGEGPFAEVTVSASTTTEASLLSEFTLGAVYPNPFNSTLIVPFTLPEQSEIRLKLYNTLGQLQFERVALHPAGQQRFIINVGEELVSGVYFLKVQTGSEKAVQKVILLR
ncbi:T9SS type A sorting domain-containing protein [bacterium]|nr:T9SS type A sorting domain-containing protein [bacterium]